MDNTYEVLRSRTIEVIDNLQGNTIDFEALYSQTIGGFEDSHKRDMLIAILFEFKDTVSLQHNPYRGLVIELLNKDVQENITRVKIVNKSGLALPEYAHIGDSGFDFKHIGEAFTLQPLERKLVSTGLYIELPLGIELQIRPKSGLSFKHGISAFFGTIDSNYRGEIKVTLVNLSNVSYTFDNLDKIAQGVLAPVNKAAFVQVNELDNNTTRGEGGHGSTGKK